MDENLAVCAGDELTVFDADGGIAIAWKAPKEADPTASSVVVTAVPLAGGGVLAMTLHSGAAPGLAIHRLDASGQALWRQELAGETAVYDIADMPGDSGLLLLTAHTAEGASFVPSLRAIVP